MPQNHHRNKSEYAKSFKMFTESAQSEYSENVKFRLARRNQEVSHQPWAWLDVGLSDNESDESVLNNAVLNDKNQSTKFNCIEITDSNSNETNSNFDASGVVDKPGDVDTPFDEQNLLQQLKKKAIKRAMEIKSGQQDTQENQSNGLLRRRPHHPLKGNSRTFQRSNSSDGHQSKSNRKLPQNLCSINRDKLFLSYGWGSQSCESSHKKTFNIKSDIDVYPSAIRASKSRETTKKEKEKVINNTKDSRRPKTAMPGKTSNPNSSRRSIDMDNHATMEWLSEYQCRFPIYDNEVYRRGLANLAPRGHFARLDTPRTCRI